MALFKPPKAWQKLAPNTIEAWLVSDDPREQHLADEALEQLGPDAAQTYLQRILVLERDTLSGRIRAVGLTYLVLYVALFAVYYVTKNEAFRLVASGGAVIITVGAIPLRQRTTVLQKRVVEWAKSKNDVHSIGTLLKALATVPAGAVCDSVREQLPQIMEQVTPHTSHLVPEKNWEQFTEALGHTVDENDIHYTPAVQALALANVRICGNVRHEPALPALQAIADKDAVTPQARELKELAAIYVAEWHQSPVICADATVAQTESLPAPLRLAA